MAESPDGYYYRTPDFIYYIDKQTMTAVPLCGKSDCLHEKAENGAAVPTHSDALLQDFPRLVQLSTDRKQKESASLVSRLADSFWDLFVYSMPALGQKRAEVNALFLFSSCKTYGGKISCFKSCLYRKTSLSTMGGERVLGYGTIKILHRNCIGFMKGYSRDDQNTICLPWQYLEKS